MAMRREDRGIGTAQPTNLDRFVEALARSCARHRIDAIRARRRRARNDSFENVKEIRIDDPEGS